MSDWSVEIRRGLTGKAVYREGANRLDVGISIGATPDIILFVGGPPPQEWDAKVPWAAGRRYEVMGRIGEAVRAKEAPNAILEFGDGGSTVVLKRAR